MGRISRGRGWIGEYGDDTGGAATALLLFHEKKLCIQSPDEMQQKQIQTAHYKLLEAMATPLGYKNKITWETIQSAYVPIGLINAIQQQQVIQEGQELLTGLMSSVLDCMMSGNISWNQSEVLEG